MSVCLTENPLSRKAQLRGNNEHVTDQHQKLGAIHVVRILGGGTFRDSVREVLDDGGSLRALNHCRPGQRVQADLLGWVLHHAGVVAVNLRQIFNLASAMHLAVRCNDAWVDTGEIQNPKEPASRANAFSGGCGRHVIKERMSDNTDVNDWVLELVSVEVEAHTTNLTHHHLVGVDVETSKTIRTGVVVLDHSALELGRSVGVSEDLDGLVRDALISTRTPKRVNQVLEKLDQIQILVLEIEHLTTLSKLLVNSDGVRLAPNAAAFLRSVKTLRGVRERTDLSQAAVGGKRLVGGDALVPEELVQPFALEDISKLLVPLGGIHIAEQLEVFVSILKALEPRLVKLVRTHRITVSLVPERNMLAVVERGPVVAPAFSILNIRRTTDHKTSRQRRASSESREGRFCNPAQRVVLSGGGDEDGGSPSEGGRLRAYDKERSTQGSSSGRPRVHVDVHSRNEPPIIKRDGCAAVDVDGVSGTRDEKVFQAPVFSVDDAVLRRHDERGDLGVTRPKRGDDLLVAHHPLVGHQEVIQAVLLGTARLDLKLGCQKGAEVAEVSAAIRED